MTRIKRRHFLQFTGSALATLGISQLDILQQDNNYGRVLAQTGNIGWYPSAQDWENIGGKFAANSSLSVVSWGSGRLDIFGIATDNGAWHKAWQNG